MSATDIVLRVYLRKLVVQGDHKSRITHLLRMLRKASAQAQAWFASHPDG